MPFADILALAPYVTAVFISACFTILLMTGKLKNFKIKTKDGEFETENPVPVEAPTPVPVAYEATKVACVDDEISSAIRGTFWLSRKYNKMEREIVTAQKDAISKRRASFFLAMEAITDKVFKRLFLVEFEDVFQLAAENNHIRENVDWRLGKVKEDYLMGKLNTLAARFNSTSNLIDSGVSWDSLEPYMRGVCIEVLCDFDKIAEEKRDEIASDFKALRRDMGVSDAMAEFLDSVSSEFRS